MLLLALAVVLLVQTARGFRVLEAGADPAGAPAAVFEPYARGNVGSIGDWQDPEAERVNEGAPFSPDVPRVYFQSSPLRASSRRVLRVWWL